MVSGNSTEVELGQYSQSPSAAIPADVELLQNEANPYSESSEGFSLPPTDGGKDAWLLLLACFMLEALIWGTSCATVLPVVLTWPACLLQNIVVSQNLLWFFSSASSRAIVFVAAISA
jgi:hypothetical protein